MRKNLILAVAITGVLLNGGYAALAQVKPTVGTSPSVSPSPTGTKTASPSAGLMENEVENLKEKVENTVAKMRSKDRKAVAGVISDLKDTVIKIKTSDDADYDVKRDAELTKIYQVGTAKKEIK